MKYIIMLMLTLSLIGCGQTGRLYLPHDPTFVGDTSEGGTL